MATSVTSVYLHVMEDVINNIRADFLSENLDESVLNELHSLWELKMIQAGNINPSEIPPRNVAPPTSVQDLNIPYQGTEEFTPTTEMLFSPYQTPTPGPDQTTTVDTTLEKTGKAGDLTNKRRGVDVNIAYEEGQEDEETVPGQAPVTKDFFTLSGKRKRDELPENYFSIPQQDGAADYASSSRIQQCDGPVDNNFDDVEEEDYNEPGEEAAPTAEAQAASAAAQTEAAGANGGESEGEEPPLNEEDDDEDDLDDLDQANDESNAPEHLVLAQFEKVTRSKNKWKCVLKDGIMHLNNRDILFVKANGEFEF